MVTKFAINGFGRIGKSILKAYAYAKCYDIKCTVINIGPAVIDMHLHLLKYDSVHGRFPNLSIIDSDTIDVGYGPIKIICESDPLKINWKTYDVDLIMECSGKFTERGKAAIHLKQSVTHVLVSAPSENADATIVYGINDYLLDIAKHKIISAASCTTNCLAPLAKILNDTLTIESGFMTTAHAYTNDQHLVDAPHKDKRRARAAGLSMIPSSTGAAKTLALIVPELAGKIDGIALRVPTPNVSFVDFTFTTEKTTSINEINAVMKSASNQLKGGILEYCEEELVSIDFNHNSASSIFDATQTRVVNNNFCRVAAWYDNEWGFSNRMLDLAKAINAQKCA